jgi:hypothetical protein
MGPNYPVFPSQPNAGTPPTLRQSPALDVLYSSSTAPTVQGRIDRAYGRHLAGTDIVVQDAPEPGTAQNELEYYAAMDDVQGDGIFDPPGSHPNIHPDAGVFAARFNLPGYHARERPYSLTEVRDVTTGRPIRAVPNGAVSMDSAAQIAFLERGLYRPQQPLWSVANLGPIPGRSIANVVQNPIPIGALEMPAVSAKTLVVAGLIGAALGAIAGLFKRPKRS